MGRIAVLALSVVFAAAALALVPAGRSAAAVKFKYRLQSGALPHEDADVLQIYLTNTSAKPATAIVIVHKLGAQHQLDATSPIQSIPLTPRQESSVVRTLDPGTFDIAEHAIEVLTTDQGVIVTTQLRRGGSEVPGRNLGYGDFLQTKGNFPDPTQ